MQSIAASYTWESHSYRILSNTCPDNIANVSQTPTDTYLTVGKCFNYDASGNYINSNDCQPVIIITNPNPEYTQAELNDINSKIVLSPNPTTGFISATWDATISGKITEIQVFNSSGINLFNLPITATQMSETINLGALPTGVYIVKFKLDRQQFINRNVIKIQSFTNFKFNRNNFDLLVN